MEVRSLWREPERAEISFGALEFHDVFKIFRSGLTETVALRGLDLRIEARELVALFGPSGSGKSTALHLAAALDDPSAGDVRVLGQSLARLGETELAAYRARDVAIVFQSGNLWPELSTRDNITLGLRLAGRRRGIRTRSTCSSERSRLPARSPAENSKGSRLPRLPHARLRSCSRTNQPRSWTPAASKRSFGR